MKAILQKTSRKAGRASGTKVAFRPQEGERFRLFLADTPDDSRSLALVPLSLPGYPDPR